MGELDGWRTCPRCQTALALEEGGVRCPACGLVVYARPSPAVCGLLVDEAGRVLLGRRAQEPGSGLWDILGGFMDEFEQPLETLRREMREELDVEVEPLELLGAIADRYGEEGSATLNVCWTARVVAGEPTPSDELLEIRWFDRASVPRREEFAFRNSHEFVEMWKG